MDRARHPRSGDKMIEFFYEVMRQKFLELVDELTLTGEDKWKNRGNMKTVWDEIVDSDYVDRGPKWQNGCQFW